MAWYLLGIKSLPQQMLMYCKVQWNFNQNAIIFIQEKVLQNVVCRMLAIMFRPQIAKNSQDINPLNWLKWLQRACSLNSKINKLCWQWEYITTGWTKTLQLLIYQLFMLQIVDTHLVSFITKHCHGSCNKNFAPDSTSYWYTKSHCGDQVKMLIWQFIVTLGLAFGGVVLTHLPLDKMAAIMQTIVSYAFS